VSVSLYHLQQNGSPSTGGSQKDMILVLLHTQGRNDEVEV